MNNRVAMVVFAYYPEDRRVRRAAEALTRSGIPVDVVCLRKPGEPVLETIEGVRAFRMPVVRKRGSMARYLWEYVSFFTLVFGLLIGLHLRNRYAVVHIHNMPDLLVLCGFVPRLTGARIILDLHDPMPEVFRAKYGLGESHPVARFLRRAESFSIRNADMVLTPNIAFRELFVGRGCEPGKIHVIMNAPDPEHFRPRGPNEPDRLPERPVPFRFMFHGAIFQRQGLDTALEALLIVREVDPDITLDVYGDGDDVERFVNRIGELRLEGTVRYHGFVPPHLMGEKIVPADAGIIPNARNVFTEINFPTRIFEYLWMGKPVIVPRTRGICDYFDDSSIFFFRPDDPADLASVIISLRCDPERRRQIMENGRRVCWNNRWEIQSRRLVELVCSLAGMMSRPAVPGSLPEGAVMNGGAR